MNEIDLNDFDFEVTEIGKYSDIIALVNLSKEVSDKKIKDLLFTLIQKEVAISLKQSENILKNISVQQRRDSIKKV